MKTRANFGKSLISPKTDIDIQVREKSNGKKTVTAIISSDEVDSYGTIIDNASMRTDNFKESGSIHAYHKPDVPVAVPAGNKITTERYAGGILTIGEAELLDNKAGEEMRYLIDKKAVNSTSIGFNIDWDNLKEEKRDGKYITTFFNAELREWSFTAGIFGSNPMAKVQRSIDMYNEFRSDISEETLGLIIPNLDLVRTIESLELTVKELEERFKKLETLTESKPNSDEVRDFSSLIANAWDESQKSLNT